MLKKSRYSQAPTVHSLPSFYRNNFLAAPPHRGAIQCRLSEDVVLFSVVKSWTA